MTSPATVYLVMYWDYSQTFPWGIFATLEAAQASVPKATWIKEEDSNGAHWAFEHYEITEEEVKGGMTTAL